MGRVGLENYTFKKTGDGAPKGESRKKMAWGIWKSFLKWERILGMPQCYLTLYEVVALKLPGLKWQLLRAQGTTQTDIRTSRQWEDDHQRAWPGMGDP